MSRGRASDELAVHLADVLAPLGAVAHRRFFGGYALTLAGQQFAMIMKGDVYLRADDALAASTRAPTVRVASYYSVPADGLADESAFVEWARRAAEVARAR